MAHHIRQGTYHYGDNSIEVPLVADSTAGASKFVKSGGPVTASSNVATVTYGYTFSATPTVFAQLYGTAVCSGAAVVSGTPGTASCYVLTSGASDVIYWIAFGSKW